MLYLFLQGFGYDPSTDDYLVVQAYCNILILDDDDPAVRVEVFSLRANEWKEIETGLLSYGNTNNPFENEIGLLLNGAVHWLAHLWEESTFNIVILAFDLTERSFLEIPLPVDFMYDQDQLSVLVALGELLSLCACVGSNHSLEIWVMEEYKVQSSWTRTIVVSRDDVPNRCFYPICSTKSGDIVGNDGKGGLAKCNDKGQLREHRSYFNGEFGPRAALYRESLLSLPCDSEQAVKDD